MLFGYYFFFCFNWKRKSDWKRKERVIGKERGIGKERVIGKGNLKRRGDGLEEKGGKGDGNEWGRG